MWYEEEEEEENKRIKVCEKEKARAQGKGKGKGKNHRVKEGDAVLMSSEPQRTLRTRLVDYATIPELHEAIVAAREEQVPVLPLHVSYIISCNCEGITENFI